MDESRACRHFSKGSVVSALMVRFTAFGPRRWSQPDAPHSREGSAPPRDSRRPQADRSVRALATRRATLRGEVQRLTSSTGIDGPEITSVTLRVIRGSAAQRVEKDGDQLAGQMSHGHTASHACGRCWCAQGGIGWRARWRWTRPQEVVQAPAPGCHHPPFGE